MVKTQIIKIIDKINSISKKEINIMEVCGTHTMSIARAGIRSLLPDNVNIISGPGCPVCVTSASDIQSAINLAKDKNNIIATFGDMLKVPSKNDSLQYYKNVKIIYNPLDAIKLAQENTDKQIIFLGIGFETTAPLSAATILTAKKLNINNFTVLPMAKTIPIAMQAILGADDNKINALILPGHVSAITGYTYFDFIKNYNVSGVVSNFEALNIIESIYLLVNYFENNQCILENNYSNTVSKEGNKKAISSLYEVFDTCDSQWRGIGLIPGTGLAIKNEYSCFDAINRFKIIPEDINEAPGCLCGTILMGKAKPPECKHYGNTCTPSNPVGPCMVSSEGTCAAFYKYIGENI